MLFRSETLAGIATGAITLAFRRWRRPTVKGGGTLVTSEGLLRIEAVEVVAESTITDGEARAAGYPTVRELMDELGRGGEGATYRIRFHLEGPDPRIELRERTHLSDEEWQKLSRRLDRLDRSGSSGPWTARVLTLLSTHEGVRAGDLAPILDLEKERFKIDMRKLKNLGLTESLDTGYRLSPRGREVLTRLEDPA